MKRWQGIAVIVVIAAAVVGEWYVASVREAGNSAGGAAARTPAAAAQSPVPAPQLAPVASSATGGGEGEGEVVRVSTGGMGTRTPAWLPLAEARESGDPRTPPIQHDAPAEHPDASVLADPEAYAAHQLAQKQRLAAAYAQAAAPELARLQSDLEQGREAGVPPEELAKVAEKIRRIEQQRQAAESMRSR